MLPSLDDAHPLPEALIRSFRERDHVRLAGLASAGEVASYRPAIVGTGPRGRFDRRPLEARDTYGHAFLQMCLARTEPERFAPGDATFHAGSTLHRAPRTGANACGR